MEVDVPPLDVPCFFSKKTAEAPHFESPSPSQLQRWHSFQPRILPPFRGGELKDTRRVGRAEGLKDNQKGLVVGKLRSGKRCLKQALEDIQIWVT